MLPVVVVHGGAGHIPKERAEMSSAGVREATRKGYAILKSGGSAMDAVVETVAMLENNPAYNAGSTIISKRVRNESSTNLFNLAMIYMHVYCGNFFYSFLCVLLFNFCA